MTWTCFLWLALVATFGTAWVPPACRPTDKNVPPPSTAWGTLGVGGLSWPWPFSCERHVSSCWEGKLSRKLRVNCRGPPAPSALLLSGSDSPTCTPSSWSGFHSCSGEPMGCSHLTGKGDHEEVHELVQGQSVRRGPRQDSGPGPPASPNGHAALLQASQPSLQSSAPTGPSCSRPRLHRTGL